MEDWVFPLLNSPASDSVPTALLAPKDAVYVMEVPETEGDTERLALSISTSSLTSEGTTPEVPSPSPICVITLVLEAILPAIKALPVSTTRLG